MRIGTLLMACVLCAAALAGAQADEPPAKSTYLVIYRAGPAWPPGKRLSELPLKEHGRYMLSLYAQGLLKFAGGFADDTGGAVVLEVVDQAQAEALVADDPAVKTGLFVHELHPWRLVPWEEHLKKQREREKEQRESGAS
jgi:uncharacterized protein